MPENARNDRFPEEEDFFEDKNLFFCLFLKKGLKRSGNFKEVGEILDEMSQSSPMKKKMKSLKNTFFDKVLLGGGSRLGLAPIPDGFFRGYDGENVTEMLLILFSLKDHLKNLFLVAENAQLSHSGHFRDFFKKKKKKVNFKWVGGNS